MKTTLYIANVIEKPETTLMSDGSRITDPNTDPRVVVAMVQVWATSSMLAINKVHQKYAAQISEIEPNRIDIILTPIGDIVLM
jgi:hypothetical protein